MSSIFREGEESINESDRSPSPGASDTGYQVYTVQIPNEDRLKTDFGTTSQLYRSLLSHPSQKETESTLARRSPLQKMIVKASQLVLSQEKLRQDAGKQRSGMVALFSLGCILSEAMIGRSWRFYLERKDTDECCIVSQKPKWEKRLYSILTNRRQHILPLWKGSIHHSSQAPASLNYRLHCRLGTRNLPQSHRTRPYQSSSNEPTPAVH